jgi:chemotaxis protein MotB
VRKKKHPEHANHERWLVSYADFITLLFAFFTTLYAISTVDQTKAGKLVYSMRTAFNVDFFQTDRALIGSKPKTSPVALLVEAINYGAVEKEQAEKRARGTGADAPGVAKKVKPGGTKTLHELADEIDALAFDPSIAGAIEVRDEGRQLVIRLAEEGLYASGSADVRPESRGVLDGLALILRDQPYAVTVEGHTDDVPVRGGRYDSNWELSTARASGVVAYFIEEHSFEPARLSAAGYGEHRPIASNDSDEGRARNRRVEIVVTLPRRDPDLTGDPGIDTLLMEGMP